jgi:2-methylcitrate dehydratase PrpD
VIPVALAAAEMRGKVSGRDLITAMAMGLETTCRLRRVPDFCLAVSGWVGEVHATFGAAVVAGKILGLDHEKMREAMGLAYSQAAGSIQAFYDGSLATRLQQGFSARSGLLSAILAKRGLTGTKNFLEGKAGFYPVYYRGIPYDLNRLTERMGEQFELLGVAMKPYPTCGFNLGPIENVLDIIQKNRLREPEISEVFLRINQRMYTNVCTPLENRYRPSTVVDAMFSLPYTVGTAVYRGDVFLEDFTPQAIGEKDRLRVVDKVKFIVDPAVEEESVEKNLPLSLHIAEVKTKNGKAFSQKMLYARGFPQKPMTLSEDCTRKLKKCIPFAAKSIPQERGEQLVGMTSALEDLEDVSSLVKILQ